MRKFCSIYVNVLLWTLGFIAALFIILSLACALQSISVNIKFCMSTNWPSQIKNACELLNIGILAATAFVALIVYKRGKLVNEVDVLLRTRDVLNSENCRKVFEYYDDVNNPDVPNVSQLDASEHDIDEYLGLLEHVYSLYICDVISKEQVNRQFKYRIESIAKDRELMSKVSIKEKEYWKDLVCLIKEFAPNEYMNTMQKINQ